MPQLTLPVVLATTIALLGAGSYAYYRAQARQAATLARITALDACLATSNQQRAQAAKNTVRGISEAVRKNHNPASDVAVLRQAQQIQDSTQTLLAKLHQLRQSWQGAENELQPGALPAQVDRYVRFIRQFAPETPPLTVPTAQTASVGWLGEFDTATEPKSAALASLTKLEAQVRQVAAEALGTQAQKVGAGCCFCFDRIGALAVPASETVAPGAVYQAQLVLAVAGLGRRFHVSAGGREVPLDPATGRGLVQFKVPAPRPGQPDTVRAQWHGRVQMQMSWSAGDTVLETTVPYFIAKPVLR